MRPFEAVTVLLLLLAWGSYLIPASRRPRWILVLTALPLVMAVIQLIVEHYRWQMVPAYALAVVLFALSLPSVLRKAAPAPSPIGCRRRIIHIAGLLLGLLALFIAVILPLSLPLFQLPTPTGPYAVGTTSFELVDESRPEVYPPDTKAHRDLMVQVWYPAQPDSSATPRPYITDNTEAFLAATFSLPAFAFDYQRMITTHSYTDAPLADALPLYPVLVFSHGFTGLINQNTPQMEELASHGYIVFSIAHPYAAMAVIYPDSRTVPSSPAEHNPFQPESGSDVLDTNKECKALSDLADVKACWQRMVNLTPTVGRVMNTWVEDTRFVLDELERMNTGERPGLFTGRLDLTRIGLFGHSLGGATAGQTCLVDTRCKAGVNMDGLQYGDLFDHALKQPFMIMNSLDGIGTSDFVYSAVENDAYSVAIPTARHLDYSDISMMLSGSPLGVGLGLVGSIGGQRMETIENSYLLAFFDKYLMDIPSPLLDGASPDFPEVNFQKR